MSVNQVGIKWKEEYNQISGYIGTIPLFSIRNESELFDYNDVKLFNGNLIQCKEKALDLFLERM